MSKRILFVDTSEGFVEAEPNFLKRLGYDIDFVDNSGEADKLLEGRAYGVMIVEPFNPEFLRRPNPLTPIMRSAKDKGIPVIVSSTQSIEFLATFFGILPRHSYQEHVERPYDTTEELIPVLERVLG